MSVGVAISTTGDPHRLEFLRACVSAWRAHLPLGASLYVTVDGDEAAVERAFEVYDHTRFGNLLQAGQGRDTREGRQGVAVNKNTGIEALMTAGCTELFLCDDDTWPIHPNALGAHQQSVLDHSMVCWSSHRMKKIHAEAGYAEWTWPRGALMYVRRHVVEQVGGLDERFGPGGHEHVEWSRRIHQAGLTPVEFGSPAHYARDRMAMNARVWWNCEDMQKQGEPLGNARARRKKLTSVRRQGDDWAHIEQIMAERDGDTGFVPYTAEQNGRASATLWTSLSAKEPGRI